jgi:hypothetical protein
MKAQRPIVDAASAYVKAQREAKAAAERGQMTGPRKTSTGSMRFEWRRPAQNCRRRERGGTAAGRAKTATHPPTDRGAARGRDSEAPRATRHGHPRNGAGRGGRG